jgi:hypothetical protein
MTSLILITIPRHTYEFGIKFPTQVVVCISVAEPLPNITEGMVLIPSPEKKVPTYELLGNIFKL